MCVRGEVEVGVLACRGLRLTAEGVLAAARTGDARDDVAAQPELETVGAGQEGVGPGIDVHGRPDGQHVVERQHERPGVLARVETAPDRPSPPAQGSGLSPRPGARPAQQPHRDETAVALLEGDVVDVADHLLLPAEDLVVEQAQPEGERRAGLDRPTWFGVASHAPAPVTTMSGIAASEATTTTTR